MDLRALDAVPLLQVGLGVETPDVVLESVPASHHGPPLNFDLIESVKSNGSKHTLPRDMLLAASGSTSPYSAIPPSQGCLARETEELVQGECVLASLLFHAADKV